MTNSTSECATGSSLQAGAKKLRDPRTWFSCAALAVIFGLMIHADASHAKRVARLSMEGTPAPTHDASSPTGYTLGQRNFLGTHERGDSYRWIAATQERLAPGPSPFERYTADTVPVGRDRLQPRLYVAWLATWTWMLHVGTGESLGLSAERIALWEPVITHGLAFLGTVVWMWVRHGPLSSAMAGLFIAFFPPLAGQFLPGVLTPRTWALLLASYTLALGLPRSFRNPATLAISVQSALAAGIALSLDPSLGFPVVLVSASVGAVAVLRQSTTVPVLTWSWVGAATVVGAWLVDQAPSDAAAGELRYVHPAYAAAWLGIGLALNGMQRIRLGARRKIGPLAEIIAAVPLVAVLVQIQFNGGYRGWLYASAAMRRLTSLDETLLFHNAFDWLVRAPMSELSIAWMPAGCALALIIAGFRWQRRTEALWPSRILGLAMPLAGALAFSFVAVRWTVIASFVALPVVWQLAVEAPAFWRRGVAVFATAFAVALLAGEKTMPKSLHRSVDATEPGPSDVEALVFRHFSHWLASHNPGQPVSALAPPELSDSLVFHGGCRVVMSSAWESFPGQVAASRILSSPESTEAEAVLESRSITHVILPSWDRVLPLLVKAHVEAGKSTLHHRLNSWVLPPYLRPLPYRLPPAPGYAGETMSVFKVVPAQDEALALSRLAEYFVEMNRPEPAKLAAKALAEGFADDPNAAIARAIVYAQLRAREDFEREIDRLAADVASGRTPFSWDRRVQRAIVLALGRRNDLGRAELEACLAEVTAEAVLELTPLQAFRLSALARSHGLSLGDAQIVDRLSAISSEYNKDKTITSVR